MTETLLELSRRLIEETSSYAMQTLHVDGIFIPGDSPIPVTGKVFGSQEIKAAMNASFDFWLTSGPYTEEFETNFAKTIGMRNAFMVNSGSSANLVAVSSLTSNKHGEKKLNAGDEVLELQL